MQISKGIVNSENKTEMEFTIERSKNASIDVPTARKAIEEVAKRIPDSILRGLRTITFIMVC
jgi:hypothetical protein